MMAGGLGSVRCTTGAAASRSAGDGAHGTYIDPSWPDRYNYAARQAVIARSPSRWPTATSLTRCSGPGT